MAITQSSLYYETPSLHLHEFSSFPWNLKFIWLMFIYPFHTWRETHCVSITTATRLMPFGEIVAVYSENHADHVNALRGQNSGRLHIKARDTLCTELYRSNFYCGAVTVVMLCAECQWQYYHCRTMGRYCNIVYRDRHCHWNKILRRSAP
jgi:hypothetical protein